jgi:hypothetical protein
MPVGLGFLALCDADRRLMGFGVGSPFELLYWLRLAALAGMVGLAIAQARRRWLRAEEGDALARRILYPSLTAILGFAIYLGLFTVVLAPVMLLYVVAIVAIWVAVPAIVSVLAVDLGARALAAERAGFWLGAGLIAYVAITLIWLGLLGVGPLLLLTGLWLEFIALTTIPVAAALIWWSFLPGGGGGSGIAETFE